MRVCAEGRRWQSLGSGTSRIRLVGNLVEVNLENLYGLLGTITFRYLQILDGKEETATVLSMEEYVQKLLQALWTLDHPVLLDNPLPTREWKESKGEEVEGNVNPALIVRALEPLSQTANCLQALNSQDASALCRKLITSLFAGPRLH